MISFRRQGQKHVSGEEMSPGKGALNVPGQRGANITICAAIGSDGSQSHQQQTFELPAATQQRPTE